VRRVTDSREKMVEKFTVLEKYFLKEAIRDGCAIIIGGEGA